MSLSHRIAAIFLSVGLFLLYSIKAEPDCLIGAFLDDMPTKEDISGFKKDYGKKPFLVMIFVDWGQFIAKNIIGDIYAQNCELLISWEPWYAVDKKGIDYDELLHGKYDRYIVDFANQLNAIKKEVFVRFAHEMNGNWYPWSGAKIGRDKYVAIYKYVKDIFDKVRADNIKWVFSVNWEDVPGENNDFMMYYPGDNYVDYIGIDGYNWGDTQSWSRWMTFTDIFGERYCEIIGKYKKPIMVTEFSSASHGGDKTIWIKDAMINIKKMENIKIFILFNVDKEVDWSFPVTKEYGKEFKKQLEDNYFRGSE